MRAIALVLIAGTLVAHPHHAHAPDALRARLRRAVRRPLLPDEHPRRARPHLGRRAARHRRDAAADRERPVPHHRHAARARWRQDRLRGDHARRHQQQHVRLQQHLLRAARLHGRELQRARMGQVLRHSRVAHPGLRHRLDPPGRPALGGARRAAPDGRAGGRRARRPPRARRDGRVVRRRPEPRARRAPPPDPRHRGEPCTLAKPRGQAAATRRLVAALAVVRPRRLAPPQRPLSRRPRALDRGDHAPDRCREAQLRHRPAPARAGLRLPLAAEPGSQRRPADVEDGARRGRALWHGGARGRGRARRPSTAPSRCSAAAARHRS